MCSHEHPSALQILRKCIVFLWCLIPTVKLWYIHQGSNNIVPGAGNIWIDDRSCYVHMGLREGDGYNFCRLQLCIMGALKESSPSSDSQQQSITLSSSSTSFSSAAAAAAAWVHHYRASAASQLHAAFLPWHDAAELSKLCSHTNTHKEPHTVSLAWHPQCLA